MSSKAYGSDDKINFDIDFTPGNKGLFGNIPGVNTDKLNKENLEHLYGNYTPVITVSSSSISEKRSSKFMNPFNDTNSSEPRYSKPTNSDQFLSSSSSNLQYLLPPICFNDNNYDCNDKDEPEFLVRNNKLELRQATQYSPQNSKGLPISNDNDLLVSSPIVQSQDIIIDKDLLTSEIDYNDHLYPWLPKQESEGWVEQDCQTHPEVAPEPHLTSNREQIKLQEIVNENQDCKLMCNSKSHKDRPSTKITRRRELKRCKKDRLLFTIQIKSKEGKQVQTNILNDDRVISEEVLGSGGWNERQGQNLRERGQVTKEDEEYEPEYKMTRSRSRKNLMSFNNYSDVSDKKKKLGPRSKSGCWTCRVRHKACPEERPTCSQCLRLNLKCDYSSVRPTYMVDPLLQANKLKEIRSITFKQKRNNFTKGILRKKCN